MKNTGAMPSTLPTMVAGSDPLTGQVSCIYDYARYLL